jgi:hypothetical protein|tara:strand:- start:140 stop:1072 length:933 start_codon:yes stop_codon:yes gene_type:complete
MIEEYIRSVYLALKDVENKENVQVEIMWNMSQYFEECESGQKLFEIKQAINDLENDYGFTSLFYEQNDKPYTMADYRRELNNKCDDFDYVIWGESDCLMPRQMFGVLEQLMEHSKSNNINRFITTFGIRKMWDESWKVLEHPEFTDKPYYDMDTPEDTKLAESSPWSIRYTMSQDEMDKVNSKTTDLDVQMISYPKFDGSGLVISSDLLRSGANIPPAVYMNGDDSAFLESCRLHMGENYRQYVVKNILKVHNRNHPNKRNYVKGEDQSKNTHFKRSTRNWYKEFNEVSKGNLNKLYYSQEPFNKKELKK